MTLLGIDTGHPIGWAHGGMDRDAIPERYGEETFGVRPRKIDAELRPTILDLYARWLAGFIAKYGIAVLAVEAPILPRVDRSDHQGSILRTCQFGFAELTAKRLGIRFVPVAPPSLRSFWLGRPRGSNAEMLAAVRASRPHCRIAGDHEGDALGLLDVARERLAGQFMLTG